jgi:hypothetical protein
MSICAASLKDVKPPRLAARPLSLRMELWVSAGAKQRDKSALIVLGLPH